MKKEKVPMKYMVSYMMNGRTIEKKFMNHDVAIAFTKIVNGRFYHLKTK